MQNYGLSHNALRLADAVNVGAEAQQNRQTSLALLPKSTGAALDQAVQAYWEQADKPAAPPDELTFESLFRRTMKQSTMVEEVLT